MKKTPDQTSDAGLLEVRLLRLFDLVYSTHSVTRAAELLGQSQPTVSIWLSKLRRQIGDPLFVRAPTGLLPTPHAELLIVKVRDILQSLREVSAPQATFDPSTATRVFRVAMTDSSHVTLLPQLLAHLRAVAPAVHLVAVPIDANTPRALQSGDADVAIGSVSWLEAGLYQQNLFPQDWVCLAHTRHPRISETLTLRAYKNEGHVAITRGTSTQVLDDALKRHRIERRVVLESPSFLGLGGIMAITDLIATLPRQIGESLASSASLRVLKCPFAVPSFTVKQHWHERYHNDDGNRWLRGLIANLYMREKLPTASLPRK